MFHHIRTRRVASFALLFATIAIGSATRAQADPPKPSFTAKPLLSPLFTDNMVLQRGMADPIWGWATPGMTVKITFQGKTTSAVTGPDGEWRTKIGPFKAGGPYTMTIADPISVNSDGSLVPGIPRIADSTPSVISDASDDTFRKLKNVMVGDVWLCSGQSNMEFGVGNLLDPEKTIAAANDPNIRLFTVAQNPALSPQATTTGQWQPCTPDTIKSQGTWSGFSAVAYFFGRDLQQKTHVPIGLLLSSWGGTPAEAWTSEAALKKNVPDFDPQLAQLDAARATPGTAAEQEAAWYTKNDPGTAGQWQDPAFDDSAWKTAAQPGYFEASGIPALANFDGVVWYRRSFDLPAADSGKDAVLHLLADDNDTTWVNETEVGATAGFNKPRAYAVPANVLKPTGNVIAVRVLDTGGNGGLYGDPAGLILNFSGGGDLPLAGPWHVQPGVSLTAATARPVSPVSNASFPSVLYNGLISPEATFGIKGAIWYQGETNAGRAAQYGRLLPAMITDWRQAWGEGNFPFLIVQLAGWQPGGEDWAKLRDAQWQTAQTVPNTEIATAIDIGDSSDPGNIHPKNKQEVGRRLALVAEAKAYGDKVPFSGPVYQKMSLSGNAATLAFTHTDGGLDAKDGKPLTGFEIAGSDGKFVPADAKIAGNTVVVSSPGVSAPTAVRYAWSGYPACSLYSGAGLPAFPFNTQTDGSTRTQFSIGQSF